MASSKPRPTASGAVGATADVPRQSRSGHPMPRGAHQHHVDSRFVLIGVESFNLCAIVMPDLGGGVSTYLLWRYMNLEI